MQSLWGNTCTGEPSLVKLRAWKLQFYQKRDSDTDVFLWFLRNFEEHLFCRTSLGDCFCEKRVKNESKSKFLQWRHFHYATTKMHFCLSAIFFVKIFVSSSMLILFRFQFNFGRNETLSQTSCLIGNDSFMKTKQY